MTIRETKSLCFEQRMHSYPFSVSMINTKLVNSDLTDNQLRDMPTVPTYSGQNQKAISSFTTGLRMGLAVTHNTLKYRRTTILLCVYVEFTTETR